MKPVRNLTLLFVLCVLLLPLGSSAQAMESRGGERLVIAKGEVIEDDLYVSANTFILEGTVRGDLVAIGSQVTIADSGVVDGDLLTLGQDVVVNGAIKDDVRMFAASLHIGEKAVVGGDVVGAAFGLDMASGSKLGGDLIFAGAQALMAGAVKQNAHFAVAGVKLDGQVGGDVEAEVSRPGEQMFNPLSYMPKQAGVPAMPSLPSGLELGPQAKIGGNLTYTADEDVTLPAGAVGGTVTRQPLPSEVQGKVVATPTPARRAVDWLVKLLRNLVTLLVVGLLLAWLAPTFVRKGAAVIRAKPLHSFGWGIVAYAAFFFALLVLGVAVIVLLILLGAISLGDLLGTILGLGMLSASGLAMAFKIAASYISKVLVGYLVGSLVLERFKPQAFEGERRVYWPLVLGVALFAILAAIPYLGMVVNIVVILLGLGALWMLGQAWWAARRFPPLPVV